MWSIAGLPKALMMLPPEAKMEVMNMSNQMPIGEHYTQIQAVLRKLNHLDTARLIREAYDIFGDKLIATTSCGISSGVLVHFLSELELPIRVVFVNTGFLFQETLDYFETLKANYRKLDFVEALPKLTKEDFLKKHGRLYLSNPDLCCAMNKIQPLEGYINQHGVRAWISAVRKSQTHQRSSFARAILTKKEIYKLHPFLDWTSDEVFTYMEKKQIPLHPLHISGKDQSLGCVPCTKGVGINGREDRWSQCEKTECGLHTDL